MEEEADEMEGTAEEWGKNLIFDASSILLKNIFFNLFFKINIAYKCCSIIWGGEN